MSPDLDERDRQKYLYGTTAWRRSYSSRAAVEGSNAQLKHNVLSLRRGDLRMMGREKNQIFATISALAANIHTARRFRYSHQMPDPEWSTPAPPAPKQTRRKRRIQLTTD